MHAGNADWWTGEASSTLREAGPTGGDWGLAMMGFAKLYPAAELTGM